MNLEALFWWQSDKVPFLWILSGFRILTDFIQFNLLVFVYAWTMGFTGSEITKLLCNRCYTILGKTQFQKLAL